LVRKVLERLLNTKTLVSFLKWQWWQNLNH